MMFQAYFFQRGSLKNLTPKKSTRKRGTLENFEDPPNFFAGAGVHLNNERSLTEFGNGNPIRVEGMLKVDGCK